MPAYYEPQSCFPRISWSRTVYPQMFLSIEFWLCIAAHGALVTCLLLEYIPFPEDDRGFVPLELVGILLGLLGLSSAMLLRDCQRWHESLTRACAHVSEESLMSVQEIQALLGRIDLALPYRFASAKYILAALYVFFFTMTNGAISARGWGELKAKGLLNDKEVEFLESQYSGDRMAILHVWASWAAQEACELASAREKIGSEMLASGLARISTTLRNIAEAARAACSAAVSPVPYQQFQLHDFLVLVAMLALGAVAAVPAAKLCYAASGVYLLVLVGTFGLRHLAASFSDPLRSSSGRMRGTFPVAHVVNTTADAIAQLLLASTTAAFDPRSSWREVNHAMFSLSQIERRTPQAAFSGGGANPCRWREAKKSTKDDFPAPPLLDAGCCHFDMESLPATRSHLGHRAAPQILKRSGSDSNAALLFSNLQKFQNLMALDAGMTDYAGKPVEFGKAHSVCTSTGSPSGASKSVSSSNRLALAGSWHIPIDSDSAQQELEDFKEKLGAVPSEASLANSFAAMCCAGGVGASRTTASSAHPGHNMSLPARGSPNRLNQATPVVTSASPCSMSNESQEVFDLARLGPSASRSQVPEGGVLANQPRVA
eukprot:TRINITY_DN19332_c0_g1_i1.p1 TRINITY_DN19332_c0_g1~~TRINITY_DN19332_c0_g1_i1.p1  ORF type:complete len:610 (+),score=81.26 TRINITY_DN19332_c0_g1_i1:25-1830(+)